MPNPSPLESITATNALPREVKSDVNVQQRVADLLEALSTSADVHGFGGRIRITLEGFEPQMNTASGENSRQVIGGSPGDWYDYEDQMSRGGSGKGGNWNDDDRVF